MYACEVSAVESSCARADLLIAASILGRTSLLLLSTSSPFFISIFCISFVHLPRRYSILCLYSHCTAMIVGYIHDLETQWMPETRENALHQTAR